MTTEGKITIVLLAAVIVGGVYSHCTLEEKVRRVETMASVCRCPVSNAGQVALGLISTNHQSFAASHTYFEIMLEGLVRKAGLPLPAARAQLKKQLGGKLPLSWRWVPDWETVPQNTTPAPR